MATITASLKSGAEYLGQLAHRGAFDQYGRYSPGEVVTASGATYVNVAPVGAGPVRWDDFSRPNRTGWGVSSSGDPWQTSPQYTGTHRAVLRDGLGVLSSRDDAGTDGQLLGAAVDLGDAEVLTRVVLEDPGAGNGNGLIVLLSTTEDGSSRQYCEVDVNSDGTVQVELSSQASPEDLHTATQTVEGLSLAGQATWIRLRRVGTLLSGTVWLAGEREPSSPQLTLEAVDAQPAGHPALYNGSWAVDVDQLVSYFAVRALSSATAPGSDSAHWAPVATALSLPAPQ